MGEALRVLLVSKPLCGPWNDSGKNWARDVARYASVGGVVHHVMVPGGLEGEWRGVDGVVPEAVYGGRGSFAPRGWDNARVLGRLLRGCPCEVVHLCFAPNPRTNRIARLALGWRGRPAVHTVLSVPARFEGIRGLLFAQRVVCVSSWTADRLRGEGVRGVEVIPASIPVGGRLREEEPGRVSRVAARLGVGEGGRPVVVFPGDYEFSRGAEVFAGAVERIWRECEADFVFACRIKRPASEDEERRLRHRLEAGVRAGRVHFVREVDDMRALLALARVVALPSESSYAKMDMPLVVLEAMAEGVPVVLADVAPLREALGPSRVGGELVPPLDPGALAARLRAWVMDGAAAAQVGAQGRGHVLGVHDASRTCLRYAEVYRELVG